MGFSESKDSGGVTVVKVDGQLIIGNRHELKDLVQTALDRGDRRLLVDFSGPAISTPRVSARWSPSPSGFAKLEGSFVSPASTTTSAHCSN